MSTDPAQIDEFRRLVSTQNGLLEQLKNQAPKKKDIWDRLATVSTFLSTVVIAALGLYFTNIYNEREGAREHQTRTYQTRVLEMQTVERFIPHLTGTEESKKVALLALSSLGSPEFATRFAQLNPSAGTEFAADVIMATASPAQQSQLPVPVSSTAAATGNEGWAYLGHFERSTGNWRTKYFDFDRRAVPDSLQNLALQVSQETGALNVRVGMPTPDGRFAEIIDVLTPGSKATIHEVREWHSTGYMWARITYGT